MSNPPAVQDFNLVPTEVTDAGRYVQQTATALISGIRSADAEVSGLMTTRQGAAAAYLAGWEETRRGAVQIREALHDMGESLGVTVATVVDLDQARADVTASPTFSLDLN
ncbi:WXG100 family type VII secretion target [Nocardia sp. NPDC057440]|uniref:WXG100 family type VII secretion target n=1 Tax=Nocardia sp. NPDC057440 TaxID=3346134 RepID=UPI00366F253D